MAEVNINPDNKVQLMFDSGVFSAWSHNEELTIDEYIEYLKSHKQHLFSYVTMDRVPDSSSKTGGFPTPEECRKSAKGSYENQQKMKEAGLSPIPVFHQGEDIKWLERYLKDGEDYIGISPWKTNITKAAQRQWLDQIYSLLTDSKGVPIVKTHGFGIGSPEFMLRYPFYTTDSTTWVLGAGFGKVFIPRFKDGKPDFSRPRLPVIISGRENAASAQHWQFDVLGEKMQDQIEAYLKEYVGVCATEARHVPEARRKANLIYYLGLCNYVHGLRFRHKAGGLFAKQCLSKEYPALKEKWNLRLMFATNCSRKFSHVMGEAGAWNRLLSYYELRKLPDEALTQYVKNGIVGKPYKYKTPAQSWGLEAYRVHRYKGFLKREKFYAKNGIA